MYHILTASQFDRKELEKIFNCADRLKNRCGDPLRGNPFLMAQGRLMATLFYEPSTRTRLSFEAAMSRLGGSSISTENASEFSSSVKGETLADTIRVVSSYADVVVLRHTSKGAAKQAAESSRVPIINAGDGAGEHPTQALLDLYTIRSELGECDGVKVSLVGDLRNGRTIHSLIYLLSRYSDVKIQLVSPDDLSLPVELTDYLASCKIPCQVCNSMKEVFAWNPDVVYMTRIQDERMGFQKRQATLCLASKDLINLPEKCVIMHPLPRREEIEIGVDGDARAAYFRQAENGLYVRMALLCGLFS